MNHNDLKWERHDEGRYWFATARVALCDGVDLLIQYWSRSEEGPGIYGVHFNARMEPSDGQPYGRSFDLKTKAAIPAFYAALCDLFDYTPDDRTREFMRQTNGSGVVKVV